MNSFISIIIPVYNVAGYIIETVESIVSQDITNYEILLINDGSTDGSGKILNDLAKLYPQTRAIHQYNKGVSVARNLGITHAKGDYLWFIDGDDKIEPDALNKLNTMLKEHQYPEVLGFNFKYFNIQPGGSQPPDKVEILSPVDGKSFLKYYQRLAVWSFIYRRDILMKNKILFQTNIMIYEDNLFNIETFNVCEKIIQTNERLYRYRQNRDGSALKSSHKDYLDSIILILERLNNIPLKIFTQKQTDVLKLNFLFSFLHNFNQYENPDKIKMFSMHLSKHVSGINNQNLATKEYRIEALVIKLLREGYLKHYNKFFIIFFKKILYRIY